MFPRIFLSEKNSGNVTLATLGVNGSNANVAVANRSLESVYIQHAESRTLGHWKVKGHHANWDLGDGSGWSYDSGTDRADWSYGIPDSEIPAEGEILLTDSRIKMHSFDFFGEDRRVASDVFGDLDHIGTGVSRTQKIEMGSPKIGWKDSGFDVSVAANTGNSFNVAGTGVRIGGWLKNPCGRRHIHCERESVG